MKRILLFLSVCLTFQHLPQQSKANIILGNSYEDCMKFQQLLDCTDCRDASTAYGGIDLPYDTIPLDDIQVDYELVTCVSPGLCPDGTLKKTCTWQRYLFFNCFKGNPVTYRWESNSLPNHCYYSQTSPPLGSETEFQAYSMSGAFNLPVTSMQTYNLVDEVYYYTKLTDQTSYDKVLCKNDWALTDQLDMKMQAEERSYYDFQYPIAMHDTEWSSTDNTPLLPLTDSNQVVGMAINGVFIFSGATPYGYDALFPKAYGTHVTPKNITLDFCLGTSEFGQSYRYYVFSPCIYPSVAKTYAAPCNNTKYPLCSQDTLAHSLYYVPTTMKNVNPIGIAKDGRLIYGPYNYYGKLWQPCDVDVCNGRYLIGQYAYVTTMFHPYFVGCWGPGNKISLKASCSNNARYCSDFSLGIQDSSSISKMIMSINIILWSLVAFYSLL